MLDKIRGIHEGKSIAVLGSAPSLKDYFQREEDIVIGINGASQILEDGDIFLSGDGSAVFKSWFNISKKVRYFVRPHSAIYSSILFPDEELRNRLIKKWEGYMEAHPEHVTCKHECLKTISNKELKFVKEFFNEIPDPIEPHIIIRSAVKYLGPISRNQKLVYIGGTSTSMGIQLAYIMGAKEIHLYGVEFSNPSKGGEFMGTNYFYEAGPNEGGETSDSQRLFMDEVIKQVRIQGVDIFSHGPTRLENSIILNSLLV